MKCFLVSFFVVLPALVLVGILPTSCATTPIPAPTTQDASGVDEALGVLLETTDRAVIAKARADYEKAIAATAQARSPELKARDAATSSDWPTNSIEYSFYVDQFATKGKRGDFRGATEMLPYLSDLGVSLLYPLPFLVSPGHDGGFDVADYLAVDPRFGTLADFENFQKQAHARGMRVKMDLVLNHISDQHEWFRKLMAGDLSYRDRFLVRDTPPEITRTVHDQEGTLLTYRESDGHGGTLEVSRRLIFPEFSASHYREISVPTKQGNKKLWVYHTFYPFQLDLDYRNPSVVREAYRWLGFWVNHGIDLFRLDAIPFLDKLHENSPRTHALVQLLSGFLRRAAPSARLEVEACEPPAAIVRYFGETVVTRDGRPTPLVATSEAQVAYDFTLMDELWLSLATHDKSPVLRSYIEAPRKPDAAIFARFLRLHDELTLEMVTPKAAALVKAAFLKPGRGVSFRRGAGIAGRMTNFLAHDPRWIRLADSMLLSQSGMIVLYYGDEIGAENDPAFAEREARERSAYFAQIGVRAEGFDARDVGRGPIAAERFRDAASGRGTKLSAEIHHAVRAMLSARREHPALSRGRTELVQTDSKEVLAYRKTSEPDKVLVVHNLSTRNLETKLGTAPGAYEDLLGGGRKKCEGPATPCRMKLAPHETLWLRP